MVTILLWQIANIKEEIIIHRVLLLNLDSLLIRLYLNNNSSNTGPIIPEHNSSIIKGILVISNLNPNINNR